MSRIGIETQENGITADQGLDSSSLNTESNTSSTYSAYNPQGVYDQVNQFFSEQDKQRKTIQETREILGESAQSLSDEQIYDLKNEIQYLVDTWLEEFEKSIFDGKTLNELIQS